MTTLQRSSQDRTRSSSSSIITTTTTTIPGRPPGRQKSLNLLGKTLPIPVATAPQLRTRRQFSFNGMRYETSGLLPPSRQQREQQQHLQQQLSRIRSGGGGGVGSASRELRMRGGGNTIIDTIGTYENAGGDNGSRPDPKKPEARSLGRDRVTTGSMNGSVRMRMAAMPRSSSEVQVMEPGKAKARSSAAKASLDFPSRSKIEEELDDEGAYVDLDEDYEDVESLGRGRKPQQQQEQRGRLLPSGAQTPTPKHHIDGYGAQQRLMFAQTLLKAAQMGAGNGGGSGGTGSGGLQLPAIGAGGMQSKMDYITLAGLVLGCMASHALFFLCWYFSWLKSQVVGLRKRFLGHANLWEFFDLEDTTRYSVQTKLVLAPLIIAGAVLYCVINMLHLLVQVVRSDVPRTVVVFVQRVANSGLLGTITMGLGGTGSDGGSSAGGVKRLR